MKFQSIFCVSLIAISAGFMALISPSQAQVVGEIRIGPPPEPRYEVLPPPRRGYIWTPGYWRWNGYRHVWVRGEYIRIRPGYRYMPPRWERRDEGDWRFRERRWERGYDER